MDSPLSSKIRKVFYIAAKLLKIAVKRKKDANSICKWGAGWTGKTLWNARHALRGKLLLAFSVQGRSAGPEAGRGVPTPPSLPLDSTHPATGQGLHALDDPKEVGYTGKN